MKAKNARRLLEIWYLSQYGEINIEHSVLKQLANDKWNGAKKELEELERLAEIGEATEKAYKNDLKLHKWDTIAERIEYVAWDVESLLEWAVEND